MMETAKNGSGRDLTDISWLNWPVHRTIVVQPLMGPRLVIILKVSLQNTSEMTLIEYDNVVDALSAYGFDQPLRVGILPRRLGSRYNLFETDGADSPHEVLAVNAIAVAQQVLRRGIIGKRLDDLLTSPARRRRLRNIEMKDLPALMAHYDKDIEHRPPLVRLFQRQKARNPARCHLTTVAGLTKTNALSHLGQRRHSSTQRARSASPSWGL